MTVTQTMEQTTSGIRMHSSKQHVQAVWVWGGGHLLPATRVAWASSRARAKPYWALSLTSPGRSAKSPSMLNRLSEMTSFRLLEGHALSSCSRCSMSLCLQPCSKHALFSGICLPGPASSSGPLPQQAVYMPCLRLPCLHLLAEHVWGSCSRWPCQVPASLQNPASSIELYSACRPVMPPSKLTAYAHGQDHVQCLANRCWLLCIQATADTASCACKCSA